jgi:hypothetical protein
MTAPAIPTREDVTAAWMLDSTFDVAGALARRADMLARQYQKTLRTVSEAMAAEAAHDRGEHDHNESRYADICAICGDDDDLSFLDAPDVCGCDDCLRKEAIR